MDKIQLNKYAPPPADLPTTQSENLDKVSFFGKTNYAGALDDRRYVFGIKRSDRLRHLYILGKSGVGKSKIFELLIRQDIAHDHGLCLIDPYGEVVDSLLNFIPVERAHDVVLIDPSSENSVMFNPISGVSENFRPQFLDGFVDIFKSMFGGDWHARLEYVLRFAILALFDYPRENISGIIPMITDQSFRDKVIPHIKNSLVKKFWEEEFAERASDFENEATIPLINKLSTFFSGPPLRNIFSSPDNALDFSEFISGHKIILVNLSKTRLGADKANFLGSLIILKIKEAAMELKKSRGSAHPPFYIYIDDCHNLMTPILESLFIEARKYDLSFTLSNQYLKQLPENASAAILSNSENIIIFRLNAEDAAQLEVEMTPVFKMKDMINLGPQEFYIKLVIDGQPQDPFSGEALTVLPPDYPSPRHKVIELSREKYGSAL